jgi:hypothetical protein
MGAGERESKRLDCPGHVVVQHHDKLEDAIEQNFILLYLVYSEV